MDIWIWILFNIFILVLLAVDIGVFNREGHVIAIKESLIWTGIWIALALAFNVLVYFWMGANSALEYFTGYLIEKSLSMDNLFVFLMIFSYFGVPDRYQHRVLFWGIVGALIMRGLLIFAGVSLLRRFDWIIYLFGAFLIFTGIRLALKRERKIHPEKNPVLKFTRFLFPVSDEFQEGKFFITRLGKRYATPMLVVLLVIETTDVMFALDSIPAILAITDDPFIVYSSNVFAILGLRALYFAIAGLMRIFAYLHYGLAVILVFVGVKMVLSDIYHIPVIMALGMVGAILAVSMGLSIYMPPSDQETVQQTKLQEPSIYHKREVEEKTDD